MQRSKRSHCKMLSEVYKEIGIEPKLAPLMGKELDNKTAKTTNKARLDIRACGVWKRGQTTSIFRFKGF